MTTQSESTFRSWRRELGFTQKQSANALGYSVSHIKLYDEGKKEPNLALRLAMSAFTNGLAPYAPNQTIPASAAA